jgi:hypothetical protein
MDRHSQGESPDLDDQIASSTTGNVIICFNNCIELPFSYYILHLITEGSTVKAQERHTLSKAFKSEIYFEMPKKIKDDCYSLFSSLFVMLVLACRS